MTRNQRQRLARLLVARTVKRTRPRAVLMVPPILDLVSWELAAATQQSEQASRVTAWGQALETERITDPHGAQWLADIHGFNAAQPTPDMTGWRKVGGK